MRQLGHAVVEAIGEMVDRQAERVQLDIAARGDAAILAANQGSGHDDQPFQRPSDGPRLDQTDEHQRGYQRQPAADQDQRPLLRRPIQVLDGHHRYQDAAVGQRHARGADVQRRQRQVERGDISYA